MKPTCETCRFWEPDIYTNGPDCEILFDGHPAAKKTENGDWVKCGECRRESPKLIGLDLDSEEKSWPENVQGVWPVTMRSDWCGEHQPAEGLSRPSVVDSGEQGP